MLLQFSCSNHKSIKEPIMFSMIASKDKTGVKKLRIFNGNHVVRIAALYGPNGSGKSNFIHAIEYAKNIVTYSMSNPPGVKINQIPHKLLGKEIPSTYDFQFVVDDIRYAYGFSVIKGSVDEEYLYYFPNKRKIKIFERKNMEITSGDKYKGKFTLSEEVLKENRLFLSCLANYSRLKEIEKAFIFFSQNLIVYKAHIDDMKTNKWYEYSMELIKQNNNVKERFISFLKALDTDIIDIKVKNENIDRDEFVDSVPDIEAKVVYNNFETDLMREESTGIQKLFLIICPILDILENGKVLIFDEFETGLHEAVVHKIIQLFYEMEADKFAQLIFTTHDTSLLDTTLFRRDQIWFTQMEPKSRATDLYSLIEIKNVRKNENLVNGYINGKYGAIPMLNDSFKAFIEELQRKN